MSDRPMTSLLASVREDAETVKTEGEVSEWIAQRSISLSDATLAGNLLSAHDTAFLRAAVREIAKRVRAESRVWKRNKALWMPDAIVDFIEGMTE